jgi:hypothetical protein
VAQGQHVCGAPAVAPRERPRRGQNAAAGERAQFQGTGGQHLLFMASKPNKKLPFDMITEVRHIIRMTSNVFSVLLHEEKRQSSAPIS